MVIPAGQDAPRLNSDGLAIAVPDEVIPNEPDPPVEVVHETTAFGVPVKLTLPVELAQSEVVLADTKGADTATVVEALPEHPHALVAVRV
jgi:hypothetical protein